MFRLKTAYADRVAWWRESERLALPGKLLARTRECTEPNPIVGTPCLEWTGARHGKGYGLYFAHGGPLMAHRLMLVANGFYDPPELVTNHICRNRLCVRPDHLEFITRGENVLCGTAPSAQNALKLCCDRGHLLSPENTYITPRGWRVCRICQRYYQRRWEARRKAALAVAA